MTSAKFRTGLYAGSFDPLTLGHVDVITKALAMVDSLTIAIGIHPGKLPLFTAEERADLIRMSCSEIAQRTGATINVVTFDDLVVKAAERASASLLIPATATLRPITATLVRQIAMMGGDIRDFVPPAVATALAQKIKAF